MKLKKWIKRIVITLVSVWLLLWGCGKMFERIPAVSDGYQNAFDYPGVLEKKYAMNGKYQVEAYSIKDEDEKIKSHDIYYPAVVKTSQKKWPVVVIANGTGTPAQKYQAIFRHLASWGFIVVGNQEEWAWEGKSSSKSQDVVLRENDNPQSPLYQRVDTVHIGLVGHSQGGMAECETGGNTNHDWQLVQETV